MNCQRTRPSKGQLCFFRVRVSGVAGRGGQLTNRTLPLRFYRHRIVRQGHFTANLHIGQGEGFGVWGPTVTIPSRDEGLTEIQVPNQLGAIVLVDLVLYSHRTAAGKIQIFNIIASGILQFDGTIVDDGSIVCQTGGCQPMPRRDGQLHALLDRQIELMVSNVCRQNSIRQQGNRVLWPCNIVDSAVVGYGTIWVLDFHSGLLLAYGTWAVIIESMGREIAVCLPANRTNRFLHTGCRTACMLFAVLDGRDRFSANVFGNEIAIRLLSFWYDLNDHTAVSVVGVSELCRRCRNSYYL